MEDNIQQLEVQGTEGRKQKVSASYTLKAQSENIKKFEALGLIDEKDAKLMKEIHGRVVRKYMEKELGA